MDIDTIYAWANENRNKLHHWFFSTDLTFYILSVSEFCFIS